MNSASLHEHPITRWLRTSHTFWFTVYASLAAFCLYTCVYAFRKTFAAAMFEGIYFAGIRYKVWLVMAQVVGYGLSKFIGIKIISELKTASRAKGIWLMSGIGGVSWLLFAIVPPPYNIAFLFINGLPLGMVWGMVFAYLEGRRTTEVLGAALSISFIFSSGLCRTAGAYLIQDWNVPELWMPIAASALFTPPLLLCLWLLDKLPPPSPLDEQLRTRREPMNAVERKHFLALFLPGIVLFVTAYVMMTTFRDFRDNFSAEVWRSLSSTTPPDIFTRTEAPISIIILVMMGSLMLIKNNKLALMINHVVIATGMMLIGISTFLFQKQFVSAEVWMILTGLGLYMGYVPFNSLFFDRLIAAFRYAGTVGFIMYVADAFGYLGSIGVLLFKEFRLTSVSWVDFFITSGYCISIIATILICGSMFYFHVRHKQLIKQSSPADPSKASARDFDLEASINTAP